MFTIIQKIKRRLHLQKLKDRIPQKVLHSGEFVAHGAYLTFVFIESHGLYGSAAGVLLIFVVINHAVGKGDEE